jgi:hypothetical protein
MFERYTEHSRRVIFFARGEASRCGSPTIDPRHLLVGVLMERSPALWGAFPAGVAEAILSQLKSSPSSSEQPSLNADIPLSSASKRALAVAAEEANQLSHREINTEHLLAGLMDEDESIVGLLKEHGIDREGIFRHIPYAPILKKLTREDLHALVNTLPEPAFAQAASSLKLMQTWPPPRPPVPPGIEEIRNRMRERMGGGPGMRGMAGGGGGSYSISPGGGASGLYSFSRGDESGLPVHETIRLHEGHEITTLERMTLSDDRKTLTFRIDVTGPGEQRSHLEVPFKVE